MKIKIPENSKLFLSKLGAKGFLYPSEDCILAPADLTVSEVNYVYSKEYGVIPVKVVEMGEVPLSLTVSEVNYAYSKEYGVIPVKVIEMGEVPLSSNLELGTTIFWVEKSYFGK